jgi:hypothetical protein
LHNQIELRFFDLSTKSISTMKLTCLSILLLATSAVAYPNGTKENRRRRTRGVPGDNRALKSGGGSTSKGMMGGMASKGSKGLLKGCQSLKIKSAPFDEVVAGISETAVGSTLVFTVYDYYTDEPLGTYTDQTTDIFVGGDFADCTFTGSFNFDFDENLEFPFVSQVMVAGTCFGASNAITGGTGQYACASGYESFFEGGEEDFFTSDLIICNTCAY